MPPIVEVEGLIQGYRRRPVISGLDLRVESGIVGLVGPNGAGKTTLLNTLATIVPPRRGRVKLFGEDLGSERSIRTARRQIGYLPQDFGYFSGFSVYEFVRYSAWIREVPTATVHESTMQAIEDVGLQARSGSKLKALSGGMLRRAGIASAIVGRPRLVLLDEPTVGLDPAQRLEFRTVIRSLREDRVVILSTHLVEDVAAVCDVVAVMSAGSIHFVGSPTELAAQAQSGAAGDTPLECGYMSVLRETGVPA